VNVLMSMRNLLMKFDRLGSVRLDMLVSRNILVMSGVIFC